MKHGKTRWNLFTAYKQLCNGIRGMGATGICTDVCLVDGAIYYNEIPLTQAFFTNPIMIPAGGPTKTSAVDTG